MPIARISEYKAQSHHFDYSGCLIIFLGSIRALGTKLTGRKNAMNIKNICSKLAIGAGVIALLIISSNPSAFAKTVKVNGSGQGTALTSAFSFDGVAPADSIVSTGKDNIGGTFSIQDVGEYSFSSTSCTAPDGT